MNKLNYLAILLLSFFPIIPLAVTAADIARDVRTGETAPQSSDGGYFEIGGGLGVFTSPIKGEDDGIGVQLFLAGQYQWRGFFIESIDGSSTDLSVGYNALNTQHWSFDVIGSSLNNDIVGSDNNELKGLSERNGDFLLGVRATGYFNNHILQLQLLDGVTNAHDGVIATIEAGRSWQVRNWNYHALLGWRYHEKQVVDYYLGISPEEAIATSLPEYNARAGSFLTTEIGATYPMSEHWVFRGTAAAVHLTDNLSASPIISNKNSGGLFATFSYVF